MIRDAAFPDWREGNWEVSSRFQRRLNGLAQDWLEAQGQRRLL
jgi:hypothetical protein